MCFCGVCVCFGGIRCARAHTHKHVVECSHFAAFADARVARVGVLQILTDTDTGEVHFDRGESIVAGVVRLQFECGALTSKFV